MAEDSPELLMKKHNASLLEDIVLKLCLQDNTDEDNESSSDSTTTDGSSVPAVPIIPLPKRSRWKKISEKERHSAINAFNITTTEKNNITITCKDGLADANENCNEISNFKNNNSAKEGCPEQVIGIRYSSIENGEGEGKIAEGGNPLQACLDRGYLTDCSESNDSSSSSTAKNALDKTNSDYGEDAYRSNFKTSFRDSLNRIYAMSHKNIVILLRNLLLLLFMVFVPASQIVVICLAIGQDPKGLHFGLVNKDLIDPSNCTVPRGCLTNDNFTGSVSCLFLDFLKQHDILDMVRCLTENIMLVQNAKID